LLEKYDKPVILISIKSGIGKASARSNESFNIISSFKELENLLTSFGGHQRAAGLSIKSENINLFREKINIIAENSVKLTGDKQSIEIDSEISMNQFNKDLFKWLKILEPYGPGNMRPVFVSHNVKVFGDIQKIGSNHLKFKMKQSGFIVDAIAYNMEQYKLILKEKDKSFNCVYVIDENKWQGQVTIQLRIKDFEVSNVRT